MLWFRKQPAAAAPPVIDGISPVALPLAPDCGLFQQHFTKLLANVAHDGGIEAYLASLAAKQHTYVGLLARAADGELTLDDLESLLDSVFTARRRVFPAFEALGAAGATALVRQLLSGGAPLAQRMQGFVDAMPGTAAMDSAGIRAAAKVRRAAWDFAAELVHFSDPVKYPLMSRWVWDQGTQSGALREFIRGNDAMREIPFDNSPGLFEGGRRWLADRIAEEGIYRDVPFWIDLVLAQAYTTYFRSVTEGSLGADFGRGAPAHEQLKKLLGIDPARADGRSRVKKSGAQGAQARLQ
ncbi:MAG: hypothetical protein ACK4N4_07320 [Burkholderiales bacterium]